ncbi:MAG: hypothetical protein PHW72_01625 [Candidatus Pacebacteria bacterium]|nr:hypothetical protein [Candidatus Paceibacterota bacterium]
MKILSLIWLWWKKIGLVIGNFVSTIVMFVFYFTVFSLVAIPFRFFSRVERGKSSTYINKKSTISALKEFESE